MRQSLSSRDIQPQDSTPRHSWLSLPGLCCQAAGGEPRDADGVAAAWALIYCAAHIFDAVQDGDPPEPWWEALGEGGAINVATGLLTSAWVVLYRLGIQRRPIQLLIEDFQRTGLHMVSGQHLDLTDPRPSLERAWAVAEAKSGAFFALACRSGARMAAAEEDVVARYGVYGLNLGLMVQISDDLGDLNDGQLAPPLPVAYCLETASPQDRERLMLLMRDCTPNAPSGMEVIEMLGDRGASLYLGTKLAQFLARADEALEAAGAVQPARDQLSALIRSLVPSIEASPL